MSQYVARLLGRPSPQVPPLSPLLPSRFAPPDPTLGGCAPGEPASSNWGLPLVTQASVDGIEGNLNGRSREEEQEPDLAISRLQPLSWLQQRSASRSAETHLFRAESQILDLSPPRRAALVPFRSVGQPAADSPDEVALPLPAHASLFSQESTGDEANSPERLPEVAPGSNAQAVMLSARNSGIAPQPESVIRPPLVGPVEGAALTPHGSLSVNSPQAGRWKSLSRISDGHALREAVTTGTAQSGVGLPVDRRESPARPPLRHDLAEPLPPPTLPAPAHTASSPPQAAPPGRLPHTNSGSTQDTGAHAPRPSRSLPDAVFKPEGGQPAQSVQEADAHLRSLPSTTAQSLASAELPSVRISIGRVEVRISQPAPPPARVPPARPPTGMSLETYLQRREGSGR